MAVCILGSLVSDVRGSVGTETFSRTLGGLIVKARSNPNQPESAARDQAQANLTNVARGWSDRLSAAHRTAWRSYGTRYPRPNRWGNPIIDSGYLAYVRLNCALKIINPAWWRYSAPIGGMLPAPIFTFIATPLNGGFLVELTLNESVHYQNNYYLGISAGKTTNVGVSYYSTPWQFFQGSLHSEGDWDPPIDYMEYPVWCGTKSRLWTRAFMLDKTTGRMSVPFQTSYFMG